MSICRNPNRRSQEHEQTEGSGGGGWITISQSVFAEVLWFSPSRQFSRAHTRAGTHMDLCPRGRLTPPRGENTGPESAGEPRTRAGILSGSNSERPMHFHITIQLALLTHAFHILGVNQPKIKNSWKKNSRKFPKAKLEFPTSQQIFTWNLYCI